MEYVDFNGQLFKRKSAQGVKSRIWGRRVGFLGTERRGARKGRTPTPSLKVHSKVGCERDLGFTRSPCAFTLLPRLASHGAARPK